MDNSFYLKNGSVLWNGAFTPLDMAVEDGHITALSRGHHNEKGLPEVDAAGLRVLPGFLDLHTHGAAGVDVNAADAEGLRTIGRFFASQGVTGWLCSVLTDTPEQTLWCMEQARQVIEGGPCGGAALLGVHLEGPCLSSEYKGAMPEHLLMHTADAELFAKYQKASGGHVRYTTLAPEIPGVPGLIPRLNAMGIVCAMGHSGAGYDQCAACVDAGVRSVTHLGNAMRLFHQHDPAIFGVALERDVYVEAICDGRHLHPGTVRLYLKAKGYDRVVAVTDSIMAAGLPPPVRFLSPDRTGWRPPPSRSRSLSLPYRTPPRLPPFIRAVRRKHACDPGCCKLLFHRPSKNPAFPRKDFQISIDNPIRYVIIMSVYR